MLLSATLYGYTHSTSHFASQSFCNSSIVASLDVYISYVLFCFLFGPDSTPTHNIDLVGLLVDFFFPEKYCMLISEDERSC